MICSPYELKKSREHSLSFLQAMCRRTSGLPDFRYWNRLRWARLMEEARTRQLTAWELCCLGYDEQPEPCGTCGCWPCECGPDRAAEDRAYGEHLEEERGREERWSRG